MLDRNREEVNLIDNPSETPSLRRADESMSNAHPLGWAISVLLSTAGAFGFSCEALCFVAIARLTTEIDLLRRICRARLRGTAILDPNHCRSCCDVWTCFRCSSSCGLYPKARMKRYMDLVTFLV